MLTSPLTDRSTKAGGFSPPTADAHDNCAHSLQQPFVDTTTPAADLVKPIKAVHASLQQIIYDSST